MASTRVDTRELKKFMKLMNKAVRKDFEREIAQWLESLGHELLRLIQDEIIRKQVVDTRLLLNSFEKGTNDNVWKASDGGLTLEVGTNIEYAKYVNDGHWTNKRGQDSRFVPGEWRGDRFVYIRGHNRGMVLRQQWIEGTHYWESALRIFERMFPRALDRKVQEWLNKYFKV